MPEWFARWFKWREDRVSRVDSARGQFRDYVEPIVLGLMMEELTQTHGKQIVSKLDALVVSGEMKWKTARNIWGWVSKAMNDAAKCKEASLCVLDANPFAGVVGPDKGKKTAKQYLYPDELLQLLSCEAVPLWGRRLYAFAAYSYMRAGEIAAMKWADVETGRGFVTVDEAVDREGDRQAASKLRKQKLSTTKPRGTKGTKTDAARTFRLEPNVLPMLQAMSVDAKDTDGVLFPVLPPPSGRGGMAAVFRDDLLAAGVRRAALHNATPTRKAITFHDLRATACTWAAIRGGSELQIRGRSGHETLSVLSDYVRDAAPIRRGSFGEVFPELPECLLGSVSRRPESVPGVPRTPTFIEKFERDTGFESPSTTGTSQRDFPRRSENEPGKVSRPETPSDTRGRGTHDALAQAWSLLRRLRGELRGRQRRRD